jgi:hypothetical protein
MRVHNLMRFAGLRFHWMRINETDGTREGNWPGDWIPRSCANVKNRGACFTS